jgi:hypothetical protein
MGYQGGVCKILLVGFLLSVIYPGLHFFCWVDRSHFCCFMPLEALFQHVSQVW